MSVVFLGACGDDGPTSSEEPSSRIEWVGTGGLYHDFPGKKDHSVLCVLVNWCGYCRKLKNETLNDTTVVRVLSESFNCVQIDAESDTLIVYRDTTATGRQLANEIYHVRGYPTMIFLRRDGSLNIQSPGYRQPADFVRLLDSVLTM